LRENKNRFGAFFRHRNISTWQLTRFSNIIEDKPLIYSEAVQALRKLNQHYTAKAAGLNRATVRVVLKVE
jgi:hypothetical protein